MTDETKQNEQQESELIKQLREDAEKKLSEMEDKYKKMIEDKNKTIIELMKAPAPPAADDEDDMLSAVKNLMKKRGY